jgi:molybdate transport system ATP-binding protein
MIRFEAHKLLDTATGKMPLHISFHLEKGQLTSLFGRSGAGKTTVLRILAGLTRADKSFIEVEDEVWDHSENKIHFAIQKRSIGFVFQDYALFPNLSVRENLEFALPEKDDGKIVNELLELMELGQLQNNKPAQLSGGQKQRVALARAIARKPKILLLDEPLSALDDDMRLRLQDYIFKAHEHFKLTTLFVSHHLPEIFRLSDQVIVLDEGRILNQGRPADVFSEKKVGSKFEAVGEVVDIKKNDIVYIISVFFLNSIIKIIATEAEITQLKIGSKVMLVSKEFNPQIQVIDP